MGNCWSSSCKRPVFVGRDQREFWFNRWKTGDTPWQTQGIHRLLEQHQELVLAGKQNARVFIPLCGNAHELLWFYRHAHNVIGVEYIEKSASEFFTESGLPFEETTCHVLKCKVFRTLDHRLQIFVCSIFEFNRNCAGTMDIVWDRGALVAVNDDERPRCVRRPDIVLLCQWIVDVVGAIPVDMVRKGFKKCAISNCLYGTEDYCVFERGDGASDGSSDSGESDDD
ncbi:hypothetical protein HPB51_006166 [Rhipicephalus microplus]|uniref:Thiopurine S-methyltransferase n=1 Tax=Rhipicephalus microplus TaxID=6941 RepID=A0A9J6E795_RHIMP|nr:hypothetical protein HPB51_006166 [Rhipicephalus microplus]